MVSTMPAEMRTILLVASEHDHVTERPLYAGALKALERDGFVAFDGYSPAGSATYAMDGVVRADVRMDGRVMEALETARPKADEWARRIREGDR